MAIETGRLLDVLDGVQRPVRTGINIILAILLGLLLARLFWLVMAPAAAGASTVSGDLPRPLADTKSTLMVDRTVLFKKNYFETSQETIEVAEDAPETRLNLVLIGVTAPTSAHIQLPNKERKSFKPGDMITNGVELVKIESDRIILSRDSNTEVLFRNPDQKSVIIPFVEGEVDDVKVVTAPAVEMVTGSREQFFASVSAQPINKNGKEYLQLSAKSSQEDFESLKFQTGDILLEAGGVPGTDLEKLSELVSLEDNIMVLVERAGKPVQISIRFLK